MAGGRTVSRSFAPFPITCPSTRQKRFKSRYDIPSFSEAAVAAPEFRGVDSAFRQDQEPALSRECDGRLRPGQIESTFHGSGELAQEACQGARNQWGLQTDCAGSSDSQQDDRQETSSESKWTARVRRRVLSIQLDGNQTVPRSCDSQPQRVFNSGHHCTIFSGDEVTVRLEAKYCKRKRADENRRVPGAKTCCVEKGFVLRPNRHNR